MRIRPASLLALTLCAGACSDTKEPPPQYFRLDAVDASPLPGNISNSVYTTTLVDSGTVHFGDSNQVDRTLYFTDYSGQIGEPYSYLLGHSHVAYTGFYVRQGNRLIISYPPEAGVSGADTATLDAAGLTIPLRSSSSYDRHVLHYTPSPPFCDGISGPCAAQ